MAVKPHPSGPGNWLIDWWAPDTTKPKKKSGKYPLKRNYETFFGTYDEAVSRWTKLCQQHQSTQTVTKNNPRMNEVIPTYLSFIELNKSKGYYNSICWAFKKLKPHFGNFPVSHVTFDMIEEFKRKHKDTPSHCNQCLRYFKTFIQWMVDQQKATKLPFKITLLQHTERLPQPPSPAEFEIILNEVKETFKKSGTSKEARAIQEALILTIYSTGLRFIEAAQLKWQNLRWEDGRCLVSETKTKIERFAIIPAEVLELLTPYKKKAGFIFTNPATSKPFTTIRKGLKAAAQKHGIPLRGPHDLRHAAGTDTLEATGDIRATQSLLGHANIKSTQRYTRIAVKRQQRVADATAQFRKQMIDEEKAERKAMIKKGKAAADKSDSSKEKAK